MQAVSERELREIARLVEVTSDAVALCQPDGTILHVNQQLLALLKEERDGVVGADIKDLIYSDIIKSVIVCLMVSATRITVVILELIRAPTFRRLPSIRTASANGSAAFPSRSPCST